jgi:hypothetical protein
MKLLIMPKCPGVPAFGLHWDFWLGYIAINLLGRVIYILWAGEGQR